jgi:murein DD-endopeptidase MepM/ murein hydrolase activator NlpD
MGCASAADRRLATWDEVKPRKRAASDLPHAVQPAKAIEVPASQRAGPRIDRALMIFRDTRVRAVKGQASSLARQNAWRQLLEEIGEACEVPPTADDLGGFIRARITLEVELDRDRRLKRQMPDKLDKAVARALSGVHERVVELRALGAAGTIAPPHTRTTDLVLGLPVSPMIVSSPFGRREDPFHGQPRFHTGVDVSAPFGTRVSSVADGTVLFSGWQGGYGNHVVVDHGNGVRTHYSHMRRRFVKSGQMVGPGDTIGTVGASGRATGPHLHFAVSNEEGAYVDPLEVLERKWGLTPEMASSETFTQVSYTPDPAEVKITDELDPETGERSLTLK